MSIHVCACGKAKIPGQDLCPKCMKRAQAQDAIDESIRRQFKPEDTMPMFGEEEKKA